MEKQMVVNYHNKLKEIIANVKGTPKLLLHSCCGPCSTTCISFLTKFFDITVFYYNPNIEPEAEYLKRKQEQIKFLENFAGQNKISFLDCDYDNEAFEKAIVGLEKEVEGGKRCSVCFNLRLKKCAQVAKAKDFDYFGTTLTVSPHKNSQVINKIGENIAQEIGIPFLYSDFKKEDGYKKSIELSREYDLYRQNYCGCNYGNKS